jgi:ABC-type microcin C transport system permease subunit YejE
VWAMASWLFGAVYVGCSAGLLSGLLDLVQLRLILIKQAAPFSFKLLVARGRGSARRQLRLRIQARRWAAPIFEWKKGVVVMVAKHLRGAAVC